MVGHGGGRVVGRMVGWAAVVVVMAVAVVAVAVVVVVAVAVVVVAGSWRRDDGGAGSSKQAGRQSITGASVLQADAAGGRAFP